MAGGMSAKKTPRKRLPGTGLAVDTSSSITQDQPFNMDGDVDSPSDEAPSDEGDLNSPNSPHEKRLPFFAGVERDRPEEIASSWSYMPQNRNAGMPKVRPQQPDLQEATGGPKGVAYGDSTPRRKGRKHRVKDDISADTGKSPLTALTFGSKSPTTTVTEGVESMSIDDTPTSESKQTHVEVRVKTTPKKEDDH